MKNFHFRCSSTTFFIHDYANNSTGTGGFGTLYIIPAKTYKKSIH